MLWFLMFAVTSCGFNVFRPAYVVLRGEAIVNAVKRLAGEAVQSARVKDARLWSFVSLSNGGSPKTCVWLNSYCTDWSTLSLALTIGPPTVTRGVHDSIPLKRPPRRRTRGSRSFRVTRQASPPLCVSTLVTAPADSPNSGA